MEDQAINEWQSYVNENLKVRRTYLDMKRMDRNIAKLSRTRNELLKKSKKRTKLFFCCLSNSISKKIEINSQKKQELLHIFKEEQQRFIELQIIVALEDEEKEFK